MQVEAQLSRRPDPALSVVVGTRNRAPYLRGLVDSLVTGTDASLTFEILIVDNGSTDGTRTVVEELAAAGRPVRYAFEPRPGVAIARNRGVSVARAPLIAFADDDQHAAPGWVEAIVRTLAENPDLHFLAGPVLPPAAVALPDWVTPRTRGAISIIDRGDRTAPIDPEHWMCLPGGNMACRRAVFESIGGFHPLPRSQDRELTVRLLQAGFVGRYVPAMLMYHDINQARVTPAYFRKWVATEGEMRAKYRFDELFDARGRLLARPLCGRRILGVSAFLYRELLAEVGRWASAKVLGRRSDAFAHELRARYLAHYVVGALNASSEFAEILARLGW